VWRITCFGQLCAALGTILFSPCNDFIGLRGRIVGLHTRMWSKQIPCSAVGVRLLGFAFLVDEGTYTKGIVEFRLLLFATKLFGG
jgi:hypothetical protein